MLMHGLPVIGTDTTGLKEMVEDFYCLPLVETEDDISIPMGLLVRWLVELLRKGTIEVERSMKRIIRWTK